MFSSDVHMDNTVKIGHISTDRLQVGPPYLNLDSVFWPEIYIIFSSSHCLDPPKISALPTEKFFEKAAVHHGFFYRRSQ